MSEVTSILANKNLAPVGMTHHGRPLEYSSVF